MKMTLRSAVSVIALSAATSAGAADLTIGIAAEPSSLDPHYHNLTPNNSMRLHVFESLMSLDAAQRVVPTLAESWAAVDDTTWEIKLRSGVSFQDGSAFDADDVIYSFCRVPQVPNSPSSFAGYLKPIASIETPDPLTLRVQTNAPYPFLPDDLTRIAIISSGEASGLVYSEEGCAAAGPFPTTEAFNTLGASVGTGPYSYVGFVQGDHVELAKNPTYWGGAAEWDKVTFKPISSDGPRVAALLAGDVDLIESPPSQDLERLRNTDGIHVVDGMSSRVIYIAMDQAHEPTPGISGTDGKNPLMDTRVRKALSIAIDRTAIVERIMGGQAVPAGQVTAPGLFGYLEDAVPQPADGAAAKALLAEAGYPDGFKIVLATPNDRYMNDDRIAQAVAQFWTRIGVETEVDAQTSTVFFSRRNDFEFSAYLAGWASGSPGAASALKSLVACPNKDTGFGSTNKAGYCNAALDADLAQALQTVDNAKREELLKAAVAIEVSDSAIIPIHYEKTPWAMRDGLTYEPRVDQYTLAAGVTAASR